MNKKRSLTGIRTTGEPHIGNYLGAIKPGIELQKEYDCLYFLADLHALTTERDPKELKKQTYDVLATWIACGFNYEKNIIFRQSDVTLVAELAWYLSCVTGMGFLEKGHSYKDAVANSREVNHGVFAYPVLMAADILLYDTNVVPVGKDQKQHVEMARDMAGSLNAVFGNVLVIPEAHIRQEVMLIHGTDGRKMSKSYNNTIEMFTSENALRKKIMSIPTDSTPMEQPKSMNGLLVGELYKLFATSEMYDDLEAKLNQGNFGWGHAKEALFDVINAELAEPRKIYDELRNDEQRLDKILADGKEKAYKIAVPTINRVREAIGFRAI